ncbi:NifB/NifX family molybdenum-iron cluster-binding protein [Sulfurovum sp.]|uniref:NifB/NifX family molybdenum-iron cluster-binding protein n=1 Tax=Sulfurovum sp. TaxID=1969726 RepID=UPI0025EAD28C|nr:NifB/NifX family molybdenum-iron cluster-binding protein [Sulfurovum sp.]
MIATAIETDSLNAALSSRFGKAKYYAFFDGEKFDIQKNPYKDGEKVMAWLHEMGVKFLLLKEYGRKPCALKEVHKITLCYPMTATPTLQEAVRIYYRIKQIP